MTTLTVQTGKDNKILRKKSLKVSDVSKKIIKLVSDMKDTSANEKGLGLAAPQVGENIRVIIIKIENIYIPMINPQITHRSLQTEIAEEGCLSLPGQYLKIERASEITVKFQDVKKGKQLLRLSGLHARIVQHEVDHLDGVLICDYVRP